MGQGECNPNAFADEDVVATVKLQLQEENRSLNMGSLQVSRIAAKKCVTLSCVSAPIKPSHCLTCGNQRSNTYSSVQGQRTEKDPWNTELSHRWGFLQEYIQFYLILVSSGPFTFTLLTMTHLFCVSCGQILIARFQKVIVGFTRVGFTFEVGGILKTLLGFFWFFFFDVCFGGCS